MALTLNLIFMQSRMKSGKNSVCRDSIVVAELNMHGLDKKWEVVEAYVQGMQKDFPKC